jgi:hypothetical protein
LCSRSTSFEVHPDAPSAGDVPESAGEKRLAAADRPENEGVARLVDKAQRHEL